MRKLNTPVILIKLLMLNNSYAKVNKIFLRKIIIVQIHWVQTKKKCSLSNYEIVQLEYKIRNFLVLFMIREAEHLVEYIHNISLNFHLDTLTFSIDIETPEPFVSLIRPQVECFNLQNRCSLSVSAFELEKTDS